MVNLSCVDVSLPGPSPAARQTPCEPNRMDLRSDRVSAEERALSMGQVPRIVWFTGLSGAGKSTISNLVDRHLTSLGKHCCLLDGDDVRTGLCKDLGFSHADRTENIRRVSEVARLMAGAGLIVLVAFISPYRADRAMARALVSREKFIEVYVDAPLALVEKRDVKGLYRLARSGKLKGLTGVDAPYEPPQNPEVHIDVARESAENAAHRIVQAVLG